MNRKALLIVAGSLVVVAFLLGFVPQYLKVRDLANQLREQLNSERDKSQMDELGLLCGYVYLQTNLKNYGLAGQYSTKCFDRVRAMNGQSALAKRDSITQGLAKGDPASWAHCKISSRARCRLPKRRRSNVAG